MEFNITDALTELKKDQTEEKTSEVIENLLYNPVDLSDTDHNLIDDLGDKFLQIAAQIFVEDLGYDFNTLVNYWEAFIGQLTEEQSQRLLKLAMEQTNLDFVEDFIIGYSQFYLDPKKSLTFFSKLDENEFHEIKFFKARCYEVMEEYEQAVNTYQDYLNSSYFQLEENMEQASVNSFYIHHTIASLLVKLKKYEEANVYFNKILNDVDFDEYLANFDVTTDKEINSFLVDYVETLEKLNNTDKAKQIKDKIKRIFE